MFLECGREKNLLCSLSNIFLPEISSYLASVGEKKNPSILTSALHSRWQLNKSVSLDVFKAVLEACSIWIVHSFIHSTSVRGLLLPCRVLYLHELGTRQHHSALQSPVPKGRLLFVWSWDRLSFTGLLWNSAEMLHWIPFCRFILFWRFCYGDLGTFNFSFSIRFFSRLLRQWPFHHCTCTICYWCYWELLMLNILCLWGILISLLKYCSIRFPDLLSRGWGIINRGSVYGFSGDGKTIVCLLIFVLPVSLAVTLGAGEEQGTPFQSPREWQRESQLDFISLLCLFLI